MKIRPYVPADSVGVRALQDSYNIEWFGGKREVHDFDNSIETFVVENDDGRIVLAVTARPELEIMFAIDAKAFSGPHARRDVMLSTWAKMIVALNNKGYKAVFGRVASHLKPFGNWLVRRAGFYPDPLEVFRFDIDRVCRRVKK